MDTTCVKVVHLLYIYIYIYIYILSGRAKYPQKKGVGGDGKSGIFIIYIYIYIYIGSCRAIYNDIAASIGFFSSSAKKFPRAVRCPRAIRIFLASRRKKTSVSGLYRCI